jgi:hypothetical protein
MSRLIQSKRLALIAVFALALLAVAIPWAYAQMHQLSNQVKTVLVCPPASVAATTATVTYADCKGFKRARFLLAIGALTQSKTADAKLTECDTSGGEYGDITSAAITQVTGGASATNALYAIEVDLTKTRKRYLKPVITIGAAGTGLVSAVIELFQADELPDTATKAGLAELIKV